MTMLEHYKSAHWEEFLPAADCFGFLWKLEGKAVDQPNRAGKGWSEVVRATLRNERGEERVCYIKRQQDYVMRSLRRPLGELSVACEFRKLKQFGELRVPTLTPVYFGEAHGGGNGRGNWRGILITEALEGFVPLRSFHHARLEGFARRRRLMRSVGEVVRRMHAAGLEHRNLYPKHLMARESESGEWDVRVIDLEASRWHRWWRGFRFRDLESLDRRSEGWSRSERMAALLAYFDAQAAGDEARDCLKYFRKRRGK